ncbi:MAG: hypothetical protein R6V56_08800, partial [Lentisphaeria bacterium]
MEPTSPSASCQRRQRLCPRANENKRTPAPAEHNQRDSPKATRNNSDGDVGATGRQHALREADGDVGST